MKKMDNEKPIKELVVISGKGGTGKTSFTASFAVLAKNAVLADCDVDAADLHLILLPEIKRREEFRSGHEAVIRQDECVACGTCVTHCRFDAVRQEENGPQGDRFQIDPFACEGCGVCVRFCPEQVIDFEERVCGEWFVSETRHGPMVHAKLAIGAENSGKLVSTVRQEARKLAAQHAKDLIIVDGPPGIGCPVIASITGASLVLVVTEPTVSGEHDMQRVLALTRHFDIPTAICVNKWDLNPAMTERIESKARHVGAAIAGRVRFDSSVTTAQIHSLAPVEQDGEAGADLRALWKNLKNIGSKDGINF
jgi:MinD superfamily P-loop ATPase